MCWTEKEYQFKVLPWFPEEKEQEEYEVTIGHTCPSEWNMAFKIGIVADIKRGKAALNDDVPWSGFIRVQNGKKVYKVCLGDCGYDAGKLELAYQVWKLGVNPMRLLAFSGYGLEHSPVDQKMLEGYILGKGDDPDKGCTRVWYMKPEHHLRHFYPNINYLCHAEKPKAVYMLKFGDIRNPGEVSIYGNKIYEEVEKKNYQNLEKWVKRVSMFAGGTFFKDNSIYFHSGDYKTGPLAWEALEKWPEDYEKQGSYTYGEALFQLYLAYKDTLTHEWYLTEVDKVFSHDTWKEGVSIIATTDYGEWVIDTLARNHLIHEDYDVYRLT